MSFFSEVNVCRKTTTAFLFWLIANPNSSQLFITQNMYIWINDLTLFEALTGGTFERLNWQNSGEFEQNFSQKSNAPVRGAGRGWAVLEMTGTKRLWRVREVIPHVGPLPIVIPLKLFLDFLRDPVFPRGLTDSQSYAPFSMCIAERFRTQWFALFAI